jgi:hypothetical protein
VQSGGEERLPATKRAQSKRLRSTFRDWTAKHTNHPREMAEIALAHEMGSDVERAYRRGDMLEKRRQMMEDWAGFLHAKQIAEQ